jgi:DNA-binding NarL/FixJ family response regulator
MERETCWAPVPRVGRAARAIRVVLVDDFPLLREGLQACLEEAGGIDVVGATGKGVDVLHLVRRLRPDVLVLDLVLPDVNGVEVARQVRATHPAVAVLILTGRDDLGCFSALVQVGIQGYLSKAAPTDELVRAIRAVASGGTWLVSEGARAVSGNSARTLTVRECEVLRLLDTGRTYQEIAGTLGVSVNTVEFHVRQVYAKLGARSRIEAVHEAHRLGLA